MAFKAGKAYFAQESFQLIVAYDHQTLLNADDWTIAKEFDSSKRKIDLSLFHLITKADVQRIWAHLLQQPSILVKIIHVDFPHLLMLWINNCGLESIQAIALFKCPSIQTISIASNRISNVRSLRKMKADRTQNIDINENLITELISLNQWYAPRLQQIQIESAVKANKIACEDSFSVFSALESKQLKSLIYDKKRRVTQRKAFVMLQQKCGRKLTGLSNW